MTLAVAFIRKLPERRNRKELIFASDSRLSCGQRFDQGTKIFDFARSDALFAFAGDTDYAYPFILQLTTAIRIYPRSVDRRYPLRNVRKHLLRVFEQVYRSIHKLPANQTLPIEDAPPVQFLFGGYDWHDSMFRIWYIDLDRANRMFRYRRGAQYFFIGDREAVQEARKRTAILLNSRGRNENSIDMEPFEVLRDIIREGNHDSVGGVPQLAKVYKYMSTQFFNVLWEVEGVPAPHVFGRPLLEIETSSWPIFDPDRPNNFSQLGNQESPEAKSDELPEKSYIEDKGFEEY